MQHLLARLAIAPGQLCADLRVSALHLVVGRLAHVVQQAAAPRQAPVQAQLLGHHAAQVGHLQAVLEHVLAVAGAELEPAQELHQLLVQRPHVGVLDGGPAHLQDVLLHLGLGFVDHLLDARGVDTSVLDQLGQRQAGRLAADVVEGADDDHAGRVVHDDVHPGAFLEGADVAPLAADDAALHLVAGDVHGADGTVGGVLGGVAVDGGGQDAAGLLLARLPELLLVLLQPGGHHVGQFPLQPLQEQFLGLVPVERADLVQLLHLLLDHALQVRRALFHVGPAVGELALAVLEVPFFFLQVPVLFFEAILALVQATFLVAQLAAQLLHLAVERLAPLEQVVLGLQFRFFGELVGLVPGGPGDLLGLGPDPLEPGPVEQAGAAVAEGQPRQGGETGDDRAE